MEQSLRELSEAARIMTAGSASVSPEQRKQAEALLMKFKRADKPYVICKHLLESTNEPYLHFLACSTLKDAVMREWGMLGDVEIDNLRDFLLNYVHLRKTSLEAYVLKQVLHTVAIIVKRSILHRPDTFLPTFVGNVCQLLTGRDTLLLGLEIAGALLSEFTVADKGLSTYMSYQHNLECKVCIEREPLYQMFVAVVEVVGKLRSAGPVTQHSREWLQLMSILHSILSWDFSFIMSKKLAQISYLSMPVVNFSPGREWAVLKEGHVLQVLVELYELFGSEQDLQHLARMCIVQLGTLNGTIFSSTAEQERFLSAYLSAVTKLVMRAASTQSVHEYHGLALAVRQLLWTNNSPDVDALGEGLWETFLSATTDLSVKVMVASTQDDQMLGDTQDVVDVVLDIWLTLLQNSDDEEGTTEASGPLGRAVLQVVECYVKCHLASPTGIRNDSTHDEEIDLESEEDDRVKFRDQMEVIGCMARRNIGPVLPHLTTLLLERCRAVRETADSQQECTPLFEDLHWLIMLVGYTLAESSTDPGTYVPVPKAVLKFLSENDSPLDMGLFQTYIQKHLGLQCKELPSKNLVVNAVLALLELGTVYQSLLGRGACHYLSPQVYSSLMWTLSRVCASYLMPNESEYSYIPQSLVLSFGEDSSLGRWLVGSFVEKVISGLVYYPGEECISEDCVSLVQTFARNPRTSKLLMEDGNFLKLVERYTTGAVVLPSSESVRRFAAAMTTCMSHLPSSEHLPFMEKVFGGMKSSVVAVLNSEQVSEVPNNPTLTNKIITALDTFYGIASAIVNKVIDAVFVTVVPVLEGCIHLMKVSQHAPTIVRSILELFCSVADSGILQIDKGQTTRLYEICYQLLKCYSVSALRSGSKMVGAEEDRYDNILLCLELLSHLCSRDFFSFDEPSSFDDSSSKLVLIGLDIIVPHIDVELLKFPKLSSEFFKLITFICEVYPEKVTNLPDGVVDQIILMLKVGLNNYNDDITFYIFNAVSALAIHSTENVPFQRKIGQIVKHTLLLISSQELPAGLYDTAADMVFTFICKCRSEYLTVVNEIVTQQESSTSQECLRSAFSTLIPNTPNLSRRDKEQFSKVFENFAINVYGVCR